MKRVIIVTSHFPPSNLASAHRGRLLGPHLREFGWEPIIVTVHHDFYEEPLDWNLSKLVPPELRVERVAALPTKPIRLIGDAGIRGFVPLLNRVLSIIDREGADFLYIAIPSFFLAPLGRIVHALRGIPYGLDYSDPWVHVWPDSRRLLTKHWVSRKLGEMLEPTAVRDARLVTGVTEGTFRDVIDRHPHLRTRATTAVMPYGGEEADHRTAAELAIKPYLLEGIQRRFRLLYAGTMWPAAETTLDNVFAAIAADREEFRDVSFVFVGTGRSPNNPTGQIRPLAEKHGLWGDVVIEFPKRIPYLDVLAHLGAADALFIFGSNQAHYTPSKVFQNVLAQRPIFAVLHRASTAADVITGTRAGRTLSFDSDGSIDIRANFVRAFREFRVFANQFSADDVDRDRLEEHSARSVARTLAGALDRAVAIELRASKGSSSALARA